MASKHSRTLCSLQPAVLLEAQLEAVARCGRVYFGRHVSSDGICMRVRFKRSIEHENKPRRARIFLAENVPCSPPPRRHQSATALAVAMAPKRARTEPSLPTATAAPKITLSGGEAHHSSLAALWRQENLTDIAVCAEGVEFKAHRAVLMARSSVFRY